MSLWRRKSTAREKHTVSMWIVALGIVACIWAYWPVFAR